MMMMHWVEPLQEEITRRQPLTIKGVWIQTFTTVIKANHRNSLKNICCQKFSTISKKDVTVAPAVFVLEPPNCRKCRIIFKIFSHPGFFSTRSKANHAMQACITCVIGVHASGWVVIGCVGVDVGVSVDVGVLADFLISDTPPTAFYLFWIDVKMIRC